MKILEICPYSGGGCGVWARVKQESLELVKRGYEVRILSSNFEKGTDKILPSEESLEKIKIKRFPAKKLGGESFMNFNFEQEVINFSPQIIIAHNYRHLHTTKSLKIAKKLRKRIESVKVFLVTHAPFVEGNITRTKLQTILVKFYDNFIGPKTLNKFDKILTISKWEIPYLIEAGAKKEKIVYIPNGIPEEFFKTKKNIQEENKLLFLGRISPKKKIETILRAIPYLEDKKIILELVGPEEEEYRNFLNGLIKELAIESRVLFTKPVYDVKDKIDKIDSCKIYILASRVEGMPQGLIEAMSRGKKVIGSDSIAIRDLIKDKKNGFLFEFDNPQDLAQKINLALKNNAINERIKGNAKRFVKKFSWKKVIAKMERLF